MIRRLAALTILATALLTATAEAGSVLDRVRQTGVVNCGGAIRPGLAFPAADHTLHGLEVDLCRAVAVAVLGPDGRSSFRPYFPEQNMRRVSGGEDDLSFLTGGELATDRLAGAVLPGPAVFYEWAAVLVRADVKAAHLDDLAGAMVCSEPGTGPERSLRAYFAGKNIPFRYSMWQEAEEMLDAFFVGRCPAIAGEATALAALKLNAEAAGHPSRLLPEPLSVSPVLATTPRVDPEWAAVVAWTVQTLLAAEAGGAPGSRNGALPLDNLGAGLNAAWQTRVIAATGSYADIYRRNVGDESPLGLPRGLNARCAAGGLMCPAVAE